MYEKYGPNFGGLSFIVRLRIPNFCYTKHERPIHQTGLPRFYPNRPLDKTIYPTHLNEEDMMDPSRKNMEPRKASTEWAIAFVVLPAAILLFFFGNWFQDSVYGYFQLVLAILFGFLIGRWSLQTIDTRAANELFTLHTEDQLRLWEELSQTGQWYYDLESGIFTGTAKAREIYGLEELGISRTEATLDDAETHIHPEDRQLVYDAIEEAIAGKTRVIDYRILVNDKIRYIRTNRIPRHDESGNVIGVYGCSRDITELIEAKLAAMSSERKLRKLIEDVPILICTIDPENFAILFHNKWYEQSLGYTAEEFQQLSTVDITHVDDREKCLQAYYRILDGTSERERLEKRYYTKDGAIFTVDLNVLAIRDEKGSLESILAVALDINARKQMEEALRESEERFRVATSSAQVGLWDYDLQEKTIYTSKESFLLVGYPDQEEGIYQDADFFKVVHPNDVQRVQETIRRHVEGETPEYRCEHRIRAADGHWVWTMEAGKVVQWTEDGKAKRMLGVQIDITPQKKMEFELIQAREEAEKANMAKSTFLANMTHEIRTPMTAILGFTDLLEAEKLDEEEAKDFLHCIHDNGERLLELINDLLDISQLDSGRFAINIRPCDYLDVVETVFENMQKRAKAKDISLVLEVPERLPHQIETDPDRLRQSLVNLIGNAIKFTEEGSVRLKLDYLSSWLDQELAVRFQVIDTGVGIAPEKMDSLFEPFVQADETMARKHGGTGLGLAITKQTIEMLGGSVQIESEFGKGSVFTIVLPVGNVPDLKMVKAKKKLGDLVCEVASG